MELIHDFLYDYNQMVSYILGLGAWEPGIEAGKTVLGLHAYIVYHKED